MPDRRAQILALLATRYDGLPIPYRRTAAITTGFVHRTIAPAVCPTCEGVDPHCNDCRGRGEIEIRRTRDPYTENLEEAFKRRGQQAPPASIWFYRETTKLGHVATRDAELERLADQTAPPVPSELDLVDEANRHPYSWELIRREMYQRFDYQALDVALEQLAGMAIHPHTDRGLQLLELWLPNPLRAPDPPTEKPIVNIAAKGVNADVRARTARDVEIRRQVLELRRPTRVVAAEFGLTVSQINRVIALGDAA